MHLINLKELKTRRLFYRMVNGRKHWFQITVEYGFDMDLARKAQQLPHFHVVGDIHRWSARSRQQMGWVSGGMLHDEISRYFPKLRPLLKWHLFEMNGYPHYYYQNARFWAEKVAGISEWEDRDWSPDPLHAFKNQLAWGTSSLDENLILTRLQTEYMGVSTDYVKGLCRIDLWRWLEPWLDERGPDMQAAFRQDMIAFGLAEMETEHA